MKLQDITAERRKGYADDGTAYDTWCIFLAFQDDAGKWQQFGMFIAPDCEIESVAAHLTNAAERLLGAPDAKPRP